MEVNNGSCPSVIYGHPFIFKKYRDKLWPRKESGDGAMFGKVTHLSTHQENREAENSNFFMSARIILCPPVLNILHI